LTRCVGAGTSRGVIAAPQHDDVDRKLLAALQDDCRQSLASLGEHVGLSPPAVLERVRRLESAGIIRGYHAVLEPRLVGLDITAFIGIGIDHPRHIAAFEKASLGMPEVLECHHVTGRHTLMIKVRARDTAGLHTLISAIRELPGVDRTETMIVLDTKMERQKIELPPASEESSGRRRARRA
jgi:Lrp/AsnC family transcriptional regulator, leucine-responsive regulatory protein